MNSFFFPPWATRETCYLCQHSLSFPFSPSSTKLKSLPHFAETYIYFYLVTIVVATYRLFGELGRRSRLELNVYVYQAVQKAKCKSLTCGRKPSVLPAIGAQEAVGTWCLWDFSTQFSIPQLSTTRADRQCSCVLFKEMDKNCYTTLFFWTCLETWIKTNVLIWMHINM